MDKEGKKGSKNSNFSNQPQRRGQNLIKGKVIEELKETWNFIVFKKGDDCGDNASQERNGRANDS